MAHKPQYEVEHDSPYTVDANMPIFGEGATPSLENGQMEYMDADGMQKSAHPAKSQRKRMEFFEG